MRLMISGTDSKRLRTVILSLLVGAAATAVGVATPAEASHETCSTASGFNVIHGTSGSDNLNGTAGPDLIVGLAGNDTINGFGGNDIICGGPGNDTINAGPGNDVVIGERTRSGTAPLGGNDTIDGGPDGSGGFGTDFLIGDYLNTGGSSSLTAPGGGDTITDPDRAVMVGDNADITTGSGAAGGNGGHDTFRISAAATLGSFIIGDNFSTDGPASGTGGHDTQNAGGGPDVLFGDNVTQTCGPPCTLATTGGGGNDYLNAGAGNDELHGGPASDICDGGAGTDTAPDGDC
ncbi:MAG TPA: hypothetical protein VFA34_12900, partial [Actinomycetota bacterium]|nr:hypothetical protein [Actinomycetota bacterium]